MKGTDTFFSQVRVLLFSMGGDIIGDLLLYLPLWTGLVLFEKNAADIYAAADSYGVFIGRYLDMMLLVVVLLCMGILPGVAKTGAHIRKKKNAMSKCNTVGNPGCISTWNVFHRMACRSGGTPGADNR